MKTKTNRTGLYVHVPFCVRKCHYCDFTITTQRSDSMRQRYLEALKKEIEFLKSSCQIPVFDTLYLGGGTPSLLSESELDLLFDILHSQFRFSAEAEITCEINPGDLSLKQLDHFLKHGINRISVGVQSLDNSLLRTLGRAHQKSHTIETVNILKGRDFRNFSLDLMLCLPGQSPEIFAETLSECLNWNPAQLTLYDLEIFTETQFGRLQSLDRLNLPSESEHARMYTEAEAVLTGRGYRHYELSSFAKPGSESRHNLLYWQGQDYLGLGPGAHSFMNGERFVLDEKVAGYLSKCESGKFEYQFREQIDAKQREIEKLITGIRLLEGIQLDEFRIIREELEENIQSVLESGLIELKNNCLKTTSRGRFLAEELISRLMP